MSSLSDDQHRVNIPTGHDPPRRQPRARPPLSDGLAPAELDAFMRAMDDAIRCGWPLPPEVRVRLSELEE